MLTVGMLKEYCRLIDNDDAPVFLLKEYAPEDQNIILGTAVELFGIANRKYVDPETKVIAQRPCKETSGCREALMIYVKDT